MGRSVLPIHVSDAACPFPLVLERARGRIGRFALDLTDARRDAERGNRVSGL